MHYETTCSILLTVAKLKSDFGLTKNTCVSHPHKSVHFESIWGKKDCIIIALVLHGKLSHGHLHSTYHDIFNTHTSHNWCFTNVIWIQHKPSVVYDVKIKSPTLYRLILLSYNKNVIFHEQSIKFCCALFCFGYTISSYVIHLINLYINISELLQWHCINHTPLPVKYPEWYCQWSNPEAYG